MTGAIFLDRDGVICENRADYVKTWDEFVFIPEAKQAIALLSRLDAPIIVVTNQSGINRRVMTSEVVDDIHRRMVQEIVAAGGRIDQVLYCPHRPEDNCRCRKPKAGMLQQAGVEFGLDLSRSHMVGDALTDLQAGRSAGCHPFLVLTGRGFKQLLPALRVLADSFTVAHSLMGVAEILLEIDRTHTWPPAFAAYSVVEEVV